MSVEKPHRGALPNTDTDTSRGSVARDFEKTPRALARLVAQADLDFYEFGLLAFIASSINYRTGDYVTTIGGLHDALDWQYSDRHLRNRLTSLREKRWIDYEVRRGPRSPYVFRLGENYKNALAEGSDFTYLDRDWSETPPSPDQTNWNAFHPDGLETADRNGALTPPSLEQGTPPYTETHTHTNTDTPTQSSEGSKTTSLGDTTLGPETRAVLESLEAARAAQGGRGE